MPARHGCQPGPRRRSTDARARSWPPRRDDAHARGERRRTGAQALTILTLHPAILAGAHLTETGARRAAELALTQTLGMAEDRGQHGVAHAALARNAVEREGNERLLDASNAVKERHQPSPTRILSRPKMRSSSNIAPAVSAIISADTAAIIGSIDSVAYMYIRTGNVTVAGEVTKIDIVNSSKELMKASSQPPVMPGRIIGAVMRRNTVQREAPSVTAACSTLRSRPDSADSTRRST